MPNCDIYETGQEPDYTIDEIARVEYLKDGGVRLYLSSDWRGGQRVEYSVRVTTPEKLMEFSRALMRIAAEAHNITQSQIMVGELTH